MLELAIGAGLGALVNRVRGGWLLKKGNGLAASVTFGLLIAFVTQNALVGLAVAGAYWLGESFGWSKWINTIPGHLSQIEYNMQWYKDRNPKTDKGLDYWLADKLFGKTEWGDYHSYVLFGMTIRGGMWWVPVVTAMLFCDAIGALDAVIVAGFLAGAFPWCYWLGYRLGKVEGYLKRSELLYGAVYGATFSAALTWSAWL